jgi:hypothetical protein
MAVVLFKFQNQSRQWEAAAAFFLQQMLPFSVSSWDSVQIVDNMAIQPRSIE